MSKSTPFLVFEWNPDNEALEIHADNQGLEKLTEYLQHLIKSKKNDHMHLMTPLWGGKELSAEAQSDNDHLINHVKIIKWNNRSNEQS